MNSLAREIVDLLQIHGNQRIATPGLIGLTDRDAKRYSLFKALRALKYGSPSLLEAASFELECSRAVGKKIGRDLTTSILMPSEVLVRPLDEQAVIRALATTPGAKGGYLVNVHNMGFIDILRNRSVAMTMGARVLSGLTGNVAWPRQTGKVAVSWQAGEGTSTTAADQSLGELSLTPKDSLIYSLHIIE